MDFELIVPPRLHLIT